MTSAVLYRWPEAAHFGRVVPKTKFYEHGKIAASTREKFVAEVQRVTWAYKLADSTIHLRATDAVPEIQVFVVDAKGDDVSDAVLAAIDKAVAFPIIFEINRDRSDASQTRMVACHKHLGGPKPKPSAYFSSGWLASETERSPIPAAVDMDSLYRGLLTPMLPLCTSAGESLAEVTDRVSDAQKLEREIETLERRLRQEPQLNRKVELRRELKDREERLAVLSGPAPTHAPRQDAEWTN